MARYPNTSAALPVLDARLLIVCSVQKYRLSLMPSSLEVDISPGMATAGVYSSRLSLMPGLCMRTHIPALANVVLSEGCGACLSRGFFWDMNHLLL